MLVTERTTEDLSALIVKGYRTPGVTECHTAFLRKERFDETPGIRACAIGLAYIGMVGDPVQAHSNYIMRGGFYTPLEFFSKELGIPLELASRISSMHSVGGSFVSASTISRIIRGWKIVDTRVEKLSLFRRLKALFSKPKPQPHPYLRLVTN
jgi:hypothetical protein